MKRLTLGSHFDGIAGFPWAASIAGIKALWATEIEPFPIQVSKKHFPEMKHYGSITDVSGTKLEPVDIITFGSPCQDMSVAGKREGLSGERSGLFMEAIRTIREMREATNGIYPRIALWENVPGAFSSNRGADFRAVLEAFTETKIPMPASGKWADAGMVRGNGRDIAWRVLDAQYWGVPQRRKRIFLVCDFGGECAGEILFEREGLPGNLAKSGKAREEATGNAGNGIKKSSTDYLTPWDNQEKRIFTNKGVAPTISGSDGGGGRTGVGYIAQPIALDGGTIARTLTARGDSSPCIDRGQEAVLVPQLYDMTHAEEVIRPVTPGLAPTLNARMGTGGNQIPITLSAKQQSITYAFLPGQGVKARGIGFAKETSPTLRAEGATPAVAFAANQRNEVRDLGDKAGAIQAHPGMKQQTFIIQSATMGGEKKQNGLGVSEGPCYTLDCRADHAVAYPDPANTLLAKANMSFRGDTDNVVVSAVDCRNNCEITDKSATIQAGGHGYSLNAQNPVRVGYAVRRLLPIECLRLQGFPDNWFDNIPGNSDTACYKATGNSIALPPVIWIMQRIAQALQTEGS